MSDYNEVVGIFPTPVYFALPEFIEPLESTAIALTHVALHSLEPLLTADHVDLAVRKKRFNQRTIKKSLQTLDFITAHYKFSQRCDSRFWRDCRKLRIRPKVSKLLKTYSDKEATLLPEVVNKIYKDQGFFGNDSWGLLFLAYGFPNVQTKHWKDERRDICMNCEHRKEKFGLNVCSLCGCVTHMKTALKQSTCPDGRW